MHYVMSLIMIISKDLSYRALDPIMYYDMSLLTLLTKKAKFEPGSFNGLSMPLPHVSLFRTTHYHVTCFKKRFER